MAVVSSLLHFEGTNGSTTFTDSIGKTWTRTGTPTISTTQKKVGLASGAFLAASRRISTPAHADFQFGTGDFTVEGWVRLTAVTGLYPMLVGSWVSGVANSWRLFFAEGRVQFVVYDEFSNEILYIESGSGAVPAATWKFVSVIRVGSVVKLLIDGTQVSQVDIPDPTNFIIGPAQPITIAGDASWTESFGGYIDEVRIIKGLGYDTSLAEATTGFGTGLPVITARITVAETLAITSDAVGYTLVESTCGETLPLIPAFKAKHVLPADGSMALACLFKFDGDEYSTVMLDEGGKSVVNGGGILQSGNGVVRGTNAFYNSSGSQLGFYIPAHADFNFGTGNFTIQTFAYFVSSAVERGIIGNEWNPTSGNGYILTWINGYLRFAFRNQNGVVKEAISTIQATSGWYFLQVIRDGDTIQLTQYNTVVATLTGVLNDHIGQTDKFYVANASSTGAYKFSTLRLDELRVLKGVVAPLTQSTFPANPGLTVGMNLPPPDFIEYDGSAELAVSVAPYARASVPVTHSEPTGPGTISLLMYFNTTDPDYETDAFIDETGKVITKFASVFRRRSTEGLWYVGPTPPVMYPAVGEFAAFMLGTASAASYLHTPGHVDFDFGSADFTIEAFVCTAGYSGNTISTPIAYTTSTAAYYAVGAGEFAFFVSSGKLNFYYLDSAQTRSIEAPSVVMVGNRWYWVAVTKSGTTLSLLIDGVVVASDTQEYYGTEVIGGAQARLNILNTVLHGLDSLRIIKGRSVQTSLADAYAGVDMWLPPVPSSTAEIVADIAVDVLIELLTGNTTGELAELLVVTVEGFGGAPVEGQIAFAMAVRMSAYGFYTANSSIFCSCDVELQVEPDALGWTLASGTISQVLGLAISGNGLVDLCAFCDTRIRIITIGDLVHGVIASAVAELPIGSVITSFVYRDIQGASAQIVGVNANGLAALGISGFADLLLKVEAACYAVTAQNFSGTCQVVIQVTTEARFKPIETAKVGAIGSVSVTTSNNSMRVTQCANITTVTT